MHIGIIPDGNRRYARRRGLSLAEAYNLGYQRLKDILYALLDREVEHVSVYAMSRDNCTKRPSSEIRILHALLAHAIDDFRRDERLREKGVKVRFFGDLELLPDNLSSQASKLEDETVDRQGPQLAVALCYSTRWEIEEAPPGQRSFDVLPPIDLIIRTGGRRRLSDFFMVNSGYAEIYFLDILWPEFTVEELDRAIAWFHRQERLFGG